MIAIKIAYWVHLVVGGAILCSGTIGNALVVSYFGFKEKRKTNYSLFITILAVFDFLASIFNTVFRLVPFFTKNRWPYDRFACKYLYSGAPLIINTVSHLILLTMCVTRYRSIVYPLRRKFRKLHIYVMLASTCVVTILIQLPILLTPVSFEKEKGTDVCIFKAHFPNTNKYVLLTGISISLGTRFYLPLMLHLYFYYQVKKHFHKPSFVSKSTTVKERNRRALRNLFKLTLLYAISTGPILHLPAIDYVVSLKFKFLWYENEFYSIIKIIIYSTGYLNNTLNIIIYAGQIPKFRSFLKNIACFRF